MEGISKSCSLMLFIMKYLKMGTGWLGIDQSIADYILCPKVKKKGGGLMFICITFLWRAYLSINVMENYPLSTF